MAAHEPRKDPRKRADALARSLTDLLVPVVNDAGLHLEGVETTRAGKYSVVRVLVDLVDGPGDLDLDSLGPVTAAVSQALDEADPVKGQYTLEVSTPVTSGVPLVIVSGCARPMTSSPASSPRLMGTAMPVSTTAAWSGSRSMALRTVSPLGTSQRHGWWWPGSRAGQQAEGL